MSEVFTRGIRIAPSHDYGSKGVTIFNNAVPTMEAEYALQLIERFGLIAARQGDAEDGAGRQTQVLLEPSAVVDRAFSIARLAFQHIEEGRMYMTLPDLNAVNKANDEKVAADEAESLARAAKKRETQAA